MLVSSPTACVDRLGGLLRFAEEKHFLQDDEPSTVLPTLTPTRFDGNQRVTTSVEMGYKEQRMWLYFLRYQQPKVLVHKTKDVHSIVNPCS